MKPRREVAETVNVGVVAFVSIAFKSDRAERSQSGKPMACATLSPAHFPHTKVHEQVCLSDRPVNRLIPETAIVGITTNLYCCTNLDNECVASDYMCLLIGPPIIIPWREACCYMDGSWVEGTLCGKQQDDQWSYCERSEPNILALAMLPTLVPGCGRLPAWKYPDWNWYTYIQH